jgi:hypothetical protein
MGILDWAYQGTLNTIHPVGFLSEFLARFGRWSFGRNFRIWKWLDIPLRSMKYLLLAFFLGAVVTMTATQLQAFIQSPYNRVADVKMGLFFLDLGKTGTLTMGVLVLASVFIQGFWCRYLCPHGALLGFAGVLMGIFLAGYLGARTAGIWSNEISDQEYVERLQEIHSPAYGHPGM